MCAQHSVKLAGACTSLTTSCYCSYRFLLLQSITLMGEQLNVHTERPGSRFRVMGPTLHLQEVQNGSDEGKFRNVLRCGFLVWASSIQHCTTEH